MSSSYQLSTYLESYLDSISTLPFELKRNFTLMRELDSRAEEKMKKIESSANRHLKQVRKERRARGRGNGVSKALEDQEEEIKHSFQECMEYADEKVGLAMQTYEMIDKHIRKLDQDLRKVEAEIAQQPRAERVKSGGEEKRSHKRKSMTGPVETPNPKRAAVGRDSALAAAALPVAPMPVDPTESVYCICKRISFGEMVGCDNPDCKIEWFHFECVGLTGPPKGKWLCDDCKQQQQNELN